jgi:ribosome-binding factor A
MPKIFISYSHEDKVLVKEVVTLLEANKHEVWIDGGSLHPSEAINTEIQEAIHSSDYVIVFLSKHAVISKWVQQEVYEALYQELKNEKTKLIPIKIEECELPRAFTKTKKFSRIYIDFIKDRKNAETQLIKILKKDPQKLFIDENYAVLNIPFPNLDIYLTGDTMNPPWGINEELKYFETVNSYLLFGFTVKPQTEFKHFVLCDLEEKKNTANKLNTTDYITGGTGSYDPEHNKQRMWFLIPNDFEFSNHITTIVGKNNEWSSKG